MNPNAGAIITQDYPGVGSGIWLPVNRASSRLEVAPRLCRPPPPSPPVTLTACAMVQVWDLATDFNSTRSMRWRHGNCKQNVRCRRRRYRW